MPYTILHISDLHRAKSDPIGNPELLSSLLADRMADEDPATIGFHQQCVVLLPICDGAGPMDSATHAKPVLRTSGALLVVLVAAALAVCAVIGGAAAPPASAHYSGFTGDGESQYWYIPSNKRQCIYVGGDGELNGCIIHTYTFVSANDTENRASVCAILFNRYDHSRYSSHCGVDFVRHCSPGRSHDGNQLNCHDQDTHTYHAGASNGSAWGTTIGIHGTF